MLPVCQGYHLYCKLFEYDVIAMVSALIGVNDKLSVYHDARTYTKLKYT